MFNTYYVTIPFFIITALFFGRYKLKRLPMAFCSLLSGVTVIFSVTFESLSGLTQFCLDYNGFDAHPLLARVCALVTIYLTGIFVTVLCYLLYTRNSKERVKKRRHIERTDYGDLNEIAYGDSMTIDEFYSMYCKG